jgi:serine/threonine protein kinase
MSDSLAGSTLGDYEVEERIGKGGMGEVYRARQISLDRLVAIKILPTNLCADRDYINRFLYEAKGAARLNHKNIVQIFDAGVAGNIYFYVMEYVDGKNLGQVVREQGKLSERDTLFIVQQAAAGLAFAHRMEVVHRDVKPENIMITHKGIVKIGDLGLAKWKVKKDSALTEVGSTMGTPYYVSPEQIRGVADIDGRADIYSLGMTIYHLLAGNPPFREGNAAAIMAQHLTEPVPPLQLACPDLSRPTLDLIEAMTVKDREDRLQSMQEVADILGEWLGLTNLITGHQSVGKDAKPERSFSTREDKWNKNIRRVWLGIGAVVTGVILAALILYVKIRLTEPSSSPQEAVQMTHFEKKETPPAVSSVAVPAASKTGWEKSVSGESDVAFSRQNLLATVINSSDNPQELGANNDPIDSLVPLSEWVVGDLDKKSKTLVRMRVLPQRDGSGVKPDSMYGWVLEHGDSITGIALELIPTHISEDCDLTIEVCEIRRPWLPYSKERGELNLREGFLEDISKNPLSHRDGTQRNADYIRSVRLETNWYNAIASQNQRWGKPGASSPVEDYYPGGCKNLNSPNETVFHITSKSVNQPIYVDLKPYFEDFIQDSQTDKESKQKNTARKRERGIAPPVKRGIIIQSVSGKGEVYFKSQYWTENPSQVVFHYRNTESSSSASKDNKS